MVVSLHAAAAGCESFTTDPLADGRFTNLAAGTESSFRWAAPTQRLEAVLDVDANPAYYLSAPLAPVTDAVDCSFSVRFRVEGFDDAYSPAAFIGFMTTTHVGAAGDGIAMVVSAANGQLVAQAQFEAGNTPSLAGDGVPLETRHDYLAVARYRALGSNGTPKRELAVEIFDGTGFTNLVGFSTKSLPAGLRLQVDRLGLQNDGARRDVDPTVGSITLTVDDLCSPADFPNRLSISPPSLSVTERNTESTTNVFTVTLSPRSSQEITVDYQISSTMARSSPPNQDFTGPNNLLEGTLTFPPDTATVPLPVIVFGDLVFEPDEPIAVELLRPQGAVLEAAQATLTIVNDDLPPVISIAGNSVVEGDSGQKPMTFLVSVKGAAEMPAAFSFRTAPALSSAVSATPGVDFVSTTGRVTVPFERMATNLEFTTNLTVQVIGDLENETRGTNSEDLIEEFLVVLDELSNLRFGADRARGLILDDDADRFVWIENEPRVYEGPAGRNTNIVFDVRLSRPASVAVTVGLSTLSGTAIEEQDFKRSSLTLTFPPSVTQVLVPIEVIGDDEPETNECFEVFLRDPPPGTIILPGKGRARGCIIDDDEPPVLSVAEVTVTEPAAGQTTTAVLVARLSVPVNYQVPFSYATSPGTAIENSDFVPVPQREALFPANTTRLELPVTVRGDGLDEEDLEYFWLQITNVRKALPAEVSARGWIRDSDPLPELRITGTNVVEGDVGSQGVSLPVQLWPKSGREVRVTYTTRDGTATVADHDYQQVSRVLRFDPGQTNQLATVDVFGDTKYEADEVFYVRLSNPVNATLRPAETEASVTITNNDQQLPTLTMADVSVTEGDTGTTSAVFVVLASFPPEQAVAFRAATLDGSAVSGRDYLGFTNVFTLPANATRLEIPVPVIGDTLDETNENFTLRLSEVQNAVPAQLEARGTILDDDPLPELRIGNASVVEGNAGTKSVSLPVTLSPASGREVRVAYATEDGTARADRDDYVPASGPITFQPNQTSATITVSVKGDFVYETDEQFCVRLSNATNATVAEPRGCVVITNDDQPPVLSVADLTVTEGDGGTRDAEFVLRLTNPSEVPVRLDYETRDGTAFAGLDYIATRSTTPLTFDWNAVTNRIRVPVIGDLVAEIPEEEYFTVRLFNVITATPSTLEARCTIRDNDGASLRLIVEDVPEILEGDSGTRPATFRVVLTRPVSQDVSFDYLTEDGTALTNNNDYVYTSGRATIPRGSTAQPISVPVRGDMTIEPDEVFYLRVRNVTGLPNAGEPRGQCTILDDDTPTVLLPVPPQISVLEGNEGTRTNVVIPVGLTWAARADVVLPYRTRNGTATGGLDFETRTNEVRIPAGQQSGQAVVPVIGDNLVESNETFDVVFFDPSNARLTNTTVTVTIVDDDYTLRLVGIALAAEDCQPANSAIDPFETVTLRVTVENPGHLPLNDVSLRLLEDSHLRVITGTNRYGFLSARSEPVTRSFEFQVLDDCGASVLLEWEASDGGRAVPLLNSATNITLGLKPDGTLDCCVPVDLRLTASGAPEPVTVGSNLVYTVRVTNAGPNPATGIVLTNRLDKQVRFQNLSGASSFTTNDGGDVVCGLGTIPPQGGTIVQLTVTTPGIAEVTNLPLQLTSYFVVSSAEREQVPLDNTTSVVTRLVPPTGWSVNHVQVKEGDSGTSTNAVFTVWRWPAGNASSVQWFTRDGTASGTSDFVAVTSPFTINFAAGQTANTTSVVVRVNGDNTPEDDETYDVVLTNPSDGQRINGPGVGTILDDDLRPILNHPSVAEGGPGDRPLLAFTVALSAPAKEPVQFRFSTTDGTATVADSDYVSVSPQTLSWAVGESHAQAVPVTVIGDGRVETNETVIAQVKDLAGRLLAQTNGVILNDDRAVFIAAVTNVVEGGPGETNHLVFAVELAPASDRVVTCAFRTADGTATLADSDYLPVSTNLEFGIGATGPLLVRVPVVGDARAEGDETVVGYLAEAVGATILATQGEASGVITNDDCLTLLVADRMPTIILEGCRPANQAVDPFETVVVNLTLRNDGLAATTNLVATLLEESGGAPRVIPITRSRDYGRLNVGASLSRSFTNRVEGDCGAEFRYHLLVEDGGRCRQIVEFPPMRLGVMPNGVTNCCRQADVAIATDFPPSIEFGHPFHGIVSVKNLGPSPVTEGELQIRLPAAGKWWSTNSWRTNSPVGTLLTWTVDALEPGDSSDFSLIGTDLPPGTPWLSGIVTADGDDPDANNNYFVASFDVTVCKGVSLYVDNHHVTEGEAASVSVRLEPATNRLVTVRLRTLDGTATAADGDFEPLAEPGILLRFDPGMTVTNVPIQTLDDALDEPPPDKFFLVRLENATGAAICRTNAEALVHIKDNDPPCLSVGDVGVNVGTGVAQAQVPVWLSSASDTNVVVDYSTRDGTAVAHTDYVPKADRLTFDPGETNKLIEIPIIGNVLDEGVEYFYVDLTNAVRATYCKPTGIVTITNQPCTLPPRVAILSPVNGAVFPPDQDVVIQAEASDPEPGGAVTTVAFRWDANPLAAVTSPLADGRWQAVWTEAPPGEHVLTAIATDNCGLSSTSAPVIISITTRSNTLPVISPIEDRTILEDFQGSADFTVSDAETPAPELRVTASSWNPMLLPADNLVLSGTGANRSIAFWPATNQFGEGWILATVDDGHVTVGELFKVTVTPVNDPPSFIPGDGPEVLEDSGPTHNANWATALSPGPANEADQGLEPFKLTTTPTNLFATLPSLDLDGTLRFAPATNAFGTNVVTVVLQDTGGTENGGVDAVTNVFTLKVLAVNDPPTLDPIADRTIRMNAPVQIVPLTGITPGPANEIQGLWVPADSSNTNLVVFPVDYVSPARSGTLRFQPRAGWSGTADITVAVSDDGGTTNGGTDRVNRQFEITVSPNIPPVVNLTHPPNGARFDAPATFPLRATASDQDGTVTGVEFFQRSLPSSDWVRLGQAAAPPYQWTVSNLPAAEYEFYAQATDNDGARADSSVVAVSVIRTNILTLTLTSPAAGASYCPGAPIVFAAEVRGTVPSGSVVEFVSPAGLLETATSAPFAVLRRDGLSSGTYELHARLADGSGTLRAVSATNRFEVLPTCGDVAILRNYPDPIVERMVELFYDERMLPFVRNGVDVFDQGEVGLTRLLGYKLIIWAALDRVGEGLTDDDVKLLGDLRAAGKSLYLIGVPVVSDTALMSTEGRANWERLAGVRPSGPVSDPNEILVHPAGYGDPIFQTTPGGFVFPPLTFTAAAAQPLELLVTNDVQVKCTVNDRPVMIVTPPVCDLDEGQARLATQGFGIEDSVPSQNLFKNTALWLLRGWYCENLELQLGLIEGPADGCAHEDLVYAYFVEHSGACGAAGVTLRQELPEGWQLVGVEGPDTDVAQVGPYVYVNLGCLDQSQRHEVRLHLRATQPGRFEHVVEVRAEAEAYKPEKHQLTVNTEIASCDIAPRLELRADASNRLVLWLFGAADRLYRIQESHDLVAWRQIGTLTGPEAQMALSISLGPEGSPRFFRAVWP